MSIKVAQSHTDLNRSGVYVRSYSGLKHNCVQLSYISAVFFLQVFAVRSGGATGVVVKGPDDKSSVAFRFVRSAGI